MQRYFCKLEYNPDYESEMIIITHSHTKFYEYAITSVNLATINLLLQSPSLASRPIIVELILTNATS